MTQPRPAPVVKPNQQPYYVRETQDWAIEQERMRHVQAIFWVGEPALFVLLWKVQDFEAGYVLRCQRCRVRDGSLASRVEDVYQQPVQATCPYCFGTTFEGGVRSKLVRPAIFNDTFEIERKSARGVIYPLSTVVETTNDFRVRQGDFVYRRDGTRWQLSQPTGILLRTGYTHPNQVNAATGYSQIPAAREDETSVAYQIPPNNAELDSWLTEPQYWPNPYTNDMEAGPKLPDDGGS